MAHAAVANKACAIRIREVEHAPIVLAATGSLAQEATIFYKQLAALLASKWNDEYCKVMGWLRWCWCALIYWASSPSLDVVCVESHLNIISRLYTIYSHCQGKAFHVA